MSEIPTGTKTHKPMSRAGNIPQRYFLEAIASLGMMVSFDEDQSYRYRIGTNTYASPLALLIESTLVRKVVIEANRFYEPTREFREWAREYDIAFRTHQAEPVTPWLLAECLAKPFHLKTRSRHTQTSTRYGSRMASVRNFQP